MERSTAQYSPILHCHGMLAGVVSGKQILESGRIPIALTTVAAAVVTVVAVVAVVAAVAAAAAV